MVNGVFLLVAAVMATTAIGAVLWPLLQSGRRSTWLILVATMVVATLGMYRLLGTPDALQTPTVSAPQSLEEGVIRLQAALQADPQRADGWALLARSQNELGRKTEAAASYLRAVQLAPDEPGLLLEAAQARAQIADHQFDDTALQWLQQARQLAPENERALWLIGIVQRQRGQNKEAAQTWESLLPRLEPAAATALRTQIDSARAAAGLAPAERPAAPTATPGAANTITVSVMLDPDFAARVRLRGDASVFVIARIPAGPPMPVAVQRHRLQGLPLTITLSDADSPMPTQRLSALHEVEVFARLSASGDATRQPGDIDSLPQRVSLPVGAPIKITLGTPDKP